MIHVSRVHREIDRKAGGNRWCRFEKKSRNSVDEALLPAPGILPHPRSRLFFDQSHPTSVTFRPSVLEACLIKQISSPFDALPLKSN